MLNVWEKIILAALSASLVLCDETLKNDEGACHIKNNRLHCKEHGECKDKKMASPHKTFLENPQNISKY